MTTLATTADAFDRLMNDQLAARYFSLIDNWKTSDCTSPDPADWPRPEMATRWKGQPERCGSCARCRPEQRPPAGDWDDWLYLGGRGTGKTRSCAEYFAEQLAINRRWRTAIVAPTYSDARDTCVEGESGLLEVFERWEWQEGPRKDYVWNRSLGELLLRPTGSRVKLFSAEKPARLRGPQHHLVWVEELAQVIKNASDAWDMLKFGLRLGDHPRTISSTTPLPLTLIREMLKDPRVATARGNTDDNAANLPAVTLRELHKKYDNTRLGRQELDGEILNDIPGALWRRAWFDAHRIDFPRLGPTFQEETNELLVPERFDLIKSCLTDHGITLNRIVIAIDPAVENEEDNDQTGLLVVGKADDKRFYVLDDLTLRETPDLVMDRLIAACDLYEANEVIAETNNGGQYIGKALRDTLKVKGRNPGSVSLRMVKAKQGKRVRAEPVANIYGQGQVSHVGTFPHLEDLLTVWTPSEGESPDRMDALVYALLHISDLGDNSGLYSAKGSAIPRHQQHRMPTTSVGSRR